MGGEFASQTRPPVLKRLLRRLAQREFVPSGAKAPLQAGYSRYEPKLVPFKAGLFAGPFPQPLEPLFFGGDDGRAEVRPLQDQIQPGHGIEPRALPPVVPEPTPQLLRALAEAEAQRRKDEALERRSMVRGLLLLAAVVVLLSMARAGWGRVFVPGWWRQW